MTAVVHRPYQIDAIDALAEALAGPTGRTQLHAACGSGKTLIGVETATRVVPGAGLLVVLAPSLALLAQTIGTWRAHARVDAVLAVCSDDTVTDAATRVAGIPAQVSTDSARIGDWLTGTGGRRLIVGTYMSAHRLADALRERDLVADLMICDEAHHLTGRPDYTTRRVLDNTFLPARRRLFMTATPRLDAAAADIAGLLSMDDEETFGPPAYRYPWSRAISEGWLDDYRITIIGVTQTQARQLLIDKSREYVERLGGTDLRMRAAQVLIAKAARQHNLRRIVAFCPRISTATQFATTMAATLARVGDAEQPAADLHTDVITGDMNDRDRQKALDRLRHPPQQGWTVLSNVRCLSEGVDIPAIDAVAFTHAKTSQVDIVQAVGRALRRSPDGTGVAHIIVPIVIPDSEEQVGDLDPGEFRVLWQVVRALRAHDETLGIELDGRRSRLHIDNPQLPDKITVELPSGTTDAVLDQITALLVRQTTSSWWVGYGHARDYYHQHAHLNVPTRYTTGGGFNLGHWINNARMNHRKGWLRRDRVEALDTIDMVWDTRLGSYQRVLSELAAHREQFGHTAVAQNFVSASGFRLGNRINTLRSNPAVIPAHIRAALDDLGMIWDTRDLRWQQLYDACYRYKLDHGNLDVPISYTTADGYPLGKRVKYARQQARDQKMDPAELATLTELGMRFEIIDTAWRDFLAACDRYVGSHGSLAEIEKTYTDITGYKLGATISYYRNLHAGTKPGGIPDNRRAELDARGMIWRIAPSRDITTEEISTLRSIAGPERGAAIVALIDTDGVTQSSIAAALGIHRSRLNIKIKQFRDTGRWTDRQYNKTR